MEIRIKIETSDVYMKPAQIDTDLLLACVSKAPMETASEQEPLEICGIKKKHIRESNRR
jgi:hypothetical protein